MGKREVPARTATTKSAKCEPRSAKCECTSPRPLHEAAIAEVFPAAFGFLRGPLRCGGMPFRNV